MQALRPVLRRQAGRCWPRLTSGRCMYRAQHNYGPHKEYFQHPHQTPLPDTSPYVPPVQHAIPLSQPVHVHSGPSRLVRAFRSLFWAVLFGTLGVAAGTGLITWEYMQPPFEAGSLEDQEIFEEILLTLENHPLIDELRKDNWVEEGFYMNRAFTSRAADTGANMMREKLVGPQGINVRSFKHPSQPYTILVFFLGFGIEGWPDTVHDGVVASLLWEGAHTHANNFYRDYVVADQGGSLSIEYKSPLRPGEIYAILVPPAGLEEGIDNTDEGRLKVVSLLMQMEAAPRVSSRFDPSSNTQNHMIEIPSVRGVDTTHAIATVEFRLVPASDLETVEDEVPEK